MERQHCGDGLSNVPDFERKSMRKVCATKL
jgi:hypothetical protein